MQFETVKKRKINEQSKFFVTISSDFSHLRARICTRTDSVGFSAVRIRKKKIVKSVWISRRDPAAWDDGREIAIFFSNYLDVYTVLNY